MLPKEMIRDKDMIRNKLIYYHEEEESVHLTLDRRFYNGMIINILDDHFLFDDERLGQIIIFFDELISIEKRLAR